VEANEDYFRFSQFAVSTSIRHPECLVILAKTKVYTFMWARHGSRPLYYVATSLLCGMFLKVACFGLFPLRANTYPLNYFPILIGGPIDF
jgi:hypothetical protein